MITIARQCVAGQLPRHTLHISLRSSTNTPIPKSYNQHHDITYQEGALDRTNISKERTEHDIAIELSEQNARDQINLSKILRKIQKDVKINPEDTTNNSLTTSFWFERNVKLSELPSIYLQLSKSRLTTLVVLTAAAGFAFNPVSAGLGTLAAVSAGTFLCSSSANACNQVMEAPFDAQMDRCKQRVMVRHLVTPLHGLMFSVTSGVLGTSLLYYCVNPLTAALGLANIVLYAGVYTTMKRYTIANTWVGSIVGAIPPAMGWAAASGTLDSGALALCALLYFWQFPHFNSLSYNIRQDYCRAGYNMMSVTDITLNGRVSLRNTAALIPLCIAIPFTGISHCSFSFYSVVINTYFTYLAWNFYKTQNKQTARELFRFSLWYLPILFGFLGIGYAFKERTSTDDKHHGDKPYIRELCPAVVLPNTGGVEQSCPVTNKTSFSSSTASS